MSHRDASRTWRRPKFYQIVCILIGMLLSSRLSNAHDIEQRILHVPDALHEDKSSRTNQDDKESHKLELGKPMERDLAGGQSHSYELDLVASQFLHVVVDQRGIDVVVALFGPDGKRLDEVDSPTGTKGAETVMVVADATGNYRLEVRSLEKDSTPGRYEIKIESVRPAKEQDRLRIPALRALMDADLLRAEGTPEAIHRAMEKYEVALSSFRAAKDRSGEGMVLASIATAYRDLREPQKALDYFNRGLALFRAAGDRDGEAHTLNDIGVFYMSLREFQMALDYFGRALPIFQAIGDRTKEARTLRIIGEVYHDLGDREKAIAYYRQALELFHSLGEKRREAWTLYNLGFTHRMLRESQPAIEYLNRAYSLYQALGDLAGEADTLNEIAFTHLLMKDEQKALELFARVRPLYKALNDREGEAYALDGVGIAYREIGDQHKALEYFNQALAVWRSAGNRSGEFMTIYQVARSERANGNLVTALSHLDAVLSDIEAQRLKINNQEFRAWYSAAQHEPYEFNISLLMQLHGLKPLNGYNASALHASERARARSLLELLTEARADIRQDADSTMLERESVLQQSLTAKAERLMQLRSKGAGAENSEIVKKEIPTIEKDIEALTNEYRQLQAQIRAKSPRYAALTQPQPLSLKEIQQLLDPDTLLLEYALGEERSFLWAVTPTTLQSFELPKRTEVEASAKRVYQLLTARSRRPEGETSQAKHLRIARADAEYPKAASALSEMILKDVSPQLLNKRLVIVGDGALQYIPFAALPQPASVNSRRGAVNSPLLINHEIVNLPSASTLFALRQHLSGRKLAAKSVAIVADPVFDKDDVRVRTTAAAPKSANQSDVRKRDAVSRDIQRAMEDLDGNSRFPPLRLAAAHWEAKEIGKLVPPMERMQALDFAASRETATSPELSQYRIVHFATHAFNNSAHPELSGIVLSLVNERGESQDGFLRLGEIFNLKLPTELVVLSGCQTGLGKEVKGEGLIGLTRGFMYAGAPRMVVSLWSVDDRATSALMARFYKRMLGGQNQLPSAALRAAQIEMWKESGWKAPYFWAGFIFQGEWKQMGAN